MLFKTSNKQDNYIINKSNHQGLYIVKALTNIIPGTPKDYVSFETDSKIQINNQYRKKHFETITNLLDISGTASHPNNEPYLQQALILSTINPTLVFHRNQNGNIKKIINKQQLKIEWVKWKKEYLPKIIPQLGMQQRFAKKYETGLNNIDIIKNNTTYLFLMPPIYELPTYINGILPINNVGVWNSRFIDGLQKGFKYYVKQILEDNIININFKSGGLEKLPNHGLVKEFYRNYLKEHDSKSYEVKIMGNYKIEKTSGIIKEGYLKQIEKFNDNFLYEISLEMQLIS